MNLNDFQEQCTATDLMRGDMLYHALGLMSEVGELVEGIITDDPSTDMLLEDISFLAFRAAKAKRSMRDDGQKVGHRLISDIENHRMEIMDSIWYCMALLSDIDCNFEESAELLLLKLKSRKARGMLTGEGDNR